MKPYSRRRDIYSILAGKVGDWTRLLAGWQANKPDLATKRPPQIGMREREDIITVYNTSIIIIIIVGNRYWNEGRSSTKNGVIRLSVTVHTLCFTQNRFRKSATMYSASHSFGTILNSVTFFRKNIYMGALPLKRYLQWASVHRNDAENSQFPST